MGARFALSEGALDQAATAAAGGQVVAQGWVGLYPVARVSIEGGSVRIDVSEQYAFVRDAPANVDSSSPIWYVPVHGRWSYEVDASFID